MTFYHLKSLTRRKQSQKIGVYSVMWGPLGATWQTHQRCPYNHFVPAGRHVSSIKRDRPIGVGHISSKRPAKHRLVQVMETTNQHGPTNGVATTQPDFRDRPIA